MKKTILIAALLTLPFVAGCKKQMYHLTGTVPFQELYPFNETDGTFEESTRTITRADVLDELNLPENAAVTGVQIESVSIDLARKPGNNATSASVTTDIKVGNSGWVHIFENYQVQLNASHVVINSFNNAGLLLLKNAVNNYFAPASTSFPDITIRVTGSANATPLIVDMTLTIKTTMNYDACLEVPEWFSGGEECTLE
jgi:hypothetical protein